MKPRVVVFVAPGCPACHEFAPRLARAVRAAGIRGQKVDVTRPAGLRLGQEMGVRYTPTTIFVTRRGTEVRRVGALEDAQLQGLIERVLR